MHKENDRYGPFRATRLWDEAVSIFSGMPCKRHRSNMRQYEDCFTGSEAVKWFHQALGKSPYFGAVVTQDKALQLLSKFYDEGIFVRVKRPSNNRQDRFKLHGIYQLNCGESLYTIKNWSSGSLNGPSQEKTDEVSDKGQPRGWNYMNVPPVKRNTPLREKQLKNREVSEKCAKIVRRSPVKSRPEIVCTRRPLPHPIPTIRSTKSPLSPRQEDEVWRYVFVEHLQQCLSDLDVSGLLWPCAVIRCRWLDYNVNRKVDPEKQLPAWFNHTLNRLFEALTNWELNHSIVNPTVEADVEDVISYLSGLPSQMVPADLSAVFHRVFLHLEASDVADDTVSSHHSAGYSSCEDVRAPGPLPPNTCYETAFTSEEPVTRIVPQSSIDTIHLSSKALSITGASYSALPEIDRAFMKRNNSAPNILDAVEESSCGRSGEAAKTDFARNYATLGSRGRSRKALSPGCNSREHECGRLKVLDRTPPSVVEKAVRKKMLTLKHIRNQSGGYVNMALNDSLRDEDLDLDAAMESLQKLMICSRANGPLDKRIDSESLHRSHSFRSDGSLSSYHSAVSSPRKSPPSWKGCEWGWHWGESKEKLAVRVFRLLLLLLPPQNRVCLTQLLKLMRCLPNQCPYTPSSILALFSGSVIPETEESARRLICFWVRNSEELFVVPPEFAADVQENKLHEKRRKVEVEVPMTYCEQVSSLQFEEQKLTTSQQALAELLDQIIKDTKMPPKEKQKRLRMFKEAYPHIFVLRFPNPDDQRSVLKSRPRAVLPLGKLRTLRV